MNGISQQQQNLFNETVPVILFGAGVPHRPEAIVHKDWTDEKHLETCLAILQLLQNNLVSDPDNPSMPLGTFRQFGSRGQFLVLDG